MVNRRHMAEVAMMILALAAPAALADGVLQVTEVPGDYYLIKAVDASDPAVEYWQCKVDVTSGCIFQFLDLTDAGDGAGGHSDYMGTNSGYNRKCSLLQFNGRGGAVGSRSLSVSGLADRLSFAAASDGSAFTITYTEDVSSAGFFQSSYGSDAIALHPGELLTTITVIITPPTENGTNWDWTIAQQNVSDHGIDGRVWAKQEFRSNRLATIPATLDSDTSYANGDWDPSAPVSFGRVTIGANALGLAEGREFIIDYIEDMVTHSQGNTVSLASWAGFEYIKYQGAYYQPPAGVLASGAWRTDRGQLRINIASSPTPGRPTADAGSDQDVYDDDADGGEPVTLDGSGSMDADGTIVSYRWLRDGDEIATGETPAVDLAVGSHQIILTVTDDDGLTDTDMVVVNVIDPYFNLPPVADAGDDQSIIDADDSGDEPITLDGAGSSDADGTIVAYTWLDGLDTVATGAGPTLAAPVGVTTLTLMVTDDDGATDSDTMRITVFAPGVNTPPTADAGVDQTVLDRDGSGSEWVFLDARGSADADGTITAYLWQEGATTISTEPLLRTELAVGVHTLTLTITDDLAATDTDTTTITVDPLTGPKQLLNLYGTPTPRFSRVTDYVWPANPGEIDICLYADDKFAALSITVDDGDPDHDWWMDLCEDYGWTLTWFKSGLTNDNWAEFGRLFAAGHEVQNHTFSHTDHDNTRPEAEIIHEYLDANRYIEDQIPGSVVDTMAYPNGVGNHDIASLLYSAARGVTGGANKPEATNYLDTRCVGTIDAHADIDAIIYGTSTVSWMGNNAYIRGWANALYHWVTDKPSTAVQLQYVHDHADLLWVDSFRTIARYCQQRDTAVVTVIENTPARVAFTLSDDMDDTTFDYPLTLKVRMHDDWSDVAATQDAQAVDVAVVAHDGAYYALVKAVPDRGEIVLTPAQATQPGDCDGDGDVDLDDFVILKTNFGRTGVTAGPAEGDCDNDGDVDLDDFVILKGHFGA